MQKIPNRLILGVRACQAHGWRKTKNEKAKISLNNTQTLARANEVKRKYHRLLHQVNPKTARFVPPSDKTLYFPLLLFQIGVLSNTSLLLRLCVAWFVDIIILSIWAAVDPMTRKREIISKVLKTFLSFKI